MATSILCTRCIGRVASRCRPFPAAIRSYSAAADPPITTPLTPGPIQPAPDSKGDQRSSAPAGLKMHINYFKNKPDPTTMEDEEYPPWLWRLLDSKSDSASVEDVGDLYSKSKKARGLAKKQAARRAQLDMLNPEKRVPVNEQTVDLPFATVTDSKYGPATSAPITRVVAAIGGVGEGLGSEIVSRGQKIKLRQTTVAIGSEGQLQVTQGQAAQARRVLKQEMRKKGRAKIKEGNFLAQM